ncbi:GntR family transcriptional regulator [Streptomyces sp. P38-E01]|uniref:GntR family transcriptional regulator n=1 Tax=Streptomyces tardus TaxID=2780544 RepID=A0A949JG18_9ACTN|nr:GntR family transcriptional regulator [Streptomyces tardus]MBU7599381.1 GntR family transcriptional regulator [Streptomyces tardus]
MIKSSGESPTPTARDQAYQWAKEAILGSRFPEGSFLEEKVVSDEAGVSRTPVREAFHRLAAEGYIQLLPRRGAQVRSVTARELFETYEMRQVLEIHGFKLLCDKRAELPPGLHEHLDRMEDPEQLERCWAGDRDAIARHATLDFFFHFSFVKASGNGVLIDLFRSLQSRHQRIAVSAVSLRPRRLRVINPEHRTLLDALTVHDFETASTTLRRHLNPDEQVISHLR